MMADCHVLCVAEKPSAAKTIASALSNNYQTFHTSSKYNKVFQFTGTVGSLSGTFSITSVSGHIHSISFTHNEAWSSCPPRDLFDCPVSYSVKSDAVRIVSFIKKQSEKATYLLICTDCDREGEAIGCSIAAEAISANARLIVKRVVFNSLSATTILNGFASLGELNHYAYNAVTVRQELDYRIGCAFTRLLTLSLSSSSYQNSRKKRPVSWGPCQSPVLKLISDAYLANSNFIPQVFHYLEVRLSRGTTITWKRNRVDDEAAAASYLEHVRSHQEDGALVVAIETEDLVKHPPLPLTTVELQKHFTKNFSYSAKQTLKIAEELYLKGLITYPRTDSNKIVNFDSVQSLLKNQIQRNDHPSWNSFLATFDVSNINYPRNGTSSDNAHDPIMIARVIKSSDITPLTHPQKQVLDYILRRFAALFMPASYAQRKCFTFKVGEEYFTTLKYRVVEKGFQKAINMKWPPSSEEAAEFDQDCSYPISHVTLRQGYTSPPPLMSEHRLLGEMERFGIGTDATAAEHINTVIQRQYAIRRGSSIVPTNSGMALIKGFLELGLAIADSSLRASMEKDFTLLSLNQITKDEAIERAVRAFREAFDHLESNMATFMNCFISVTSPELLNNPFVLIDGNISPCKCGGQMALSTNNIDLRVTCTFCDVHFDFSNGKREEKIITKHLPEVQCVMCGFFVVEVKSPNFSTAKPYCPNCHFSNHSFTSCWKCFEPSCPLSKKNIQRLSLFPCTKCSRTKKPGLFKLRSGHSGPFLGCSSFPKCKTTLSFGQGDVVETKRPCLKCHDSSYCVILFNGSEICTRGCDQVNFLRYITNVNPGFSAPRPKAIVNSLPPSHVPLPNNAVASNASLISEKVVVNLPTLSMRASRKCGLCRQPGHDRRSCPTAN
ncbi:hypothetical protein P9112_000927 [Eukaryota sp. TZLM1-RC]